MEKSDFQKAVEGTPEISTAYRSGLQVLKRSGRGAFDVAENLVKGECSLAGCNS